MQRCAKEKYKLVYQVFTRAHNTQNICAHCPIDATLMLAHYSECSQHHKKIILRSPLSKYSQSTTMAYLIRGLGPSPTPPHGDLNYY